MSIVHKLKGHEDRVRFVAWSPFGDKFVSASDDRTLIIWDASTGEKILELKGHTDWVMGCAWSPKGDFIVSCSCDNTCIIWNAGTGEKISMLKGHKGFVYGVAYHGIITPRETSSYPAPQTRVASSGMRRLEP